MSVQSVYPTIRYSDVRGAIEWLSNVLGFRERMVSEEPDGTIGHAQLEFRSNLIMLGPTRAGEVKGRSWVYLVEPSIDDHYRTLAPELASVREQIAANEKQQQATRAAFPRH